MTDKSIDLSAYFIDLTASVEIDLPDGEPMMFGGERVSIEIYSPASKEHARAMAERERFLTNKTLRAMGNSKKRNADDNDDESRIKFLTAITAAVHNFPVMTAEAIYAEPRLRYIADQVDAFAGRLGNFYSAGKKS